MNFLKTSIWTGISTIIKILSGLVVNKIVAIYIGPAGIALIGQFQSFLGIVTTLGNGAINSGLTKYVAEYHEDKKKRDHVISAALIITILFSIILGGIVFLLSGYLSTKILHSDEYPIIFKVLGITLVLISLNSFILSLLNGLKKIKLFIIVNIASSLLSLIVTSILTIKYQLFGALLSSILIQGIVLFISLPKVIKLQDVRIKFTKFVKKDVYAKLFAFSLMSIVSILATSLSQIVVRDYLIDHFSMEQAGYWQAVWKVSEIYLLVLTTSLSIYYLPKLSELQGTGELRREILSWYKIIIPFLLIATSAIYFLRDIIIWILFTPDFVKMRSLFFYQLLGDFFKLVSWILSYIMVAKALIKPFIITEILFSLSFYFLTVLFTNYNGLIGITQAFALNYFLYLVLMILLFSNLLLPENKILRKINLLQSKSQKDAN